MPDSFPKGERLIGLNDLPRRGEHIIGEIDTEAGPRLLVVHWRREKRIDNQERTRARGEGLLDPRRALMVFLGRTSD